MMKTTRTILSFGATAALLFTMAACTSQDPSSGAAIRTQVYEQHLTQQVFIETDHPYANNQTKEWEIAAPHGTTHLTLRFARFETEEGYDFVTFLDRDGAVLSRLSGAHTGETFDVDGDYVKIHFASDYSVTEWGLSIDSYSYVVQNDHPTDHRPYCGAIGSRSEGWYWGDTGELIKYASCADAGTPECRGITSRSEGWYVDGTGLIVWDNCHHTVRIAIAGEHCGPSIGYSCFDNLYCQGVPTNRIGGTGTCLATGACKEDADCTADGNVWNHVDCTGRASCNHEKCVWECTNPGPWSWTSVLLQGVESEHPYANSFEHTWTITRTGATKIKVDFSRIDLEPGYDWIAVAANGQAPQYIEGSHRNFTSQTFDGDTLNITLHSDYSVNDWGFKAIAVTYYEQLPEDSCNTTADCPTNQSCIPHYCINAFVPCYGHCARDTRCDDGSQLACRRAIPMCPEGTILAYQEACYVCVDPNTCQPPVAGAEGDPCDDAHQCQDGLMCKNVVDGHGTCHDTYWCEQATVGGDCGLLDHIMTVGRWTCNDHHCAWQTGVFHSEISSQDTPLTIPDNDANGVDSHVSVTALADSCTWNVAVDLNITHTYRGDLVVSLTDPSGHTAVLQNRHGGFADDLVFEHEAVTGLAQDDVNGTWTLNVSDHAAIDQGNLQSWTLHLDCQ